MSALRDEILAADDMQYEVVVVPEWRNKEVCIRSLTGEERDAYEAGLLREVKKLGKRGVKTERKFDPRKVRAKLVIIAACHGVGDPRPIFMPEDVDKLAAKNGAALDRLFDVAQKLAGIGNDDLEDLMGNSEAGPSGSSG